MRRTVSLKSALMGTLAAAVCGLSLAGHAQEATEKPTGAEGMIAKIEAVVTAIDMEKREVTVKNAEGRVMVLHVGEEARNLARVEVGDTVIAEYFEGLVFQVEPAGTGKPLRVEKTLSDRAPKGQKPAGSVTTYVELVARVEGIDRAKRLVTLRGPRAVVTLNVKDDLDLSTVEVNDMVKVNFVEGYAIKVEEQ